MTVSFDGTTLTTTTYMPRFVKHESVAGRSLTTMPLAREDGEVLIADRRGTKIIRLQGVIKGSSQSDLETQIDTFTELFSRPEKNLDIDWAGGTRRYVATCAKHDFDRDHYHLSVVPWTAEFEVLSGVGKDTSTTTAANAVTVSFDPSGSPDGSTSFTLAGSKPPKPTVTIVGSYGTLVRGIEYKNLDNGERLVITYPGAWDNSKTIIANFEDRTVTGNVTGVPAGTPLNFFGVFPRMKIGTNNIRITAGGIVNQKSADDSTSDLSSTSVSIQSTTHRKAQSFMVPYTDQTFSGVTLAVRKAGTPGTLRWEIHTDNAGAPSGTLVDATNAKGTFSGIGTSDAYITSNTTTGNPFTLQANTVYWLVLKADATVDGSNYYDFSLPTLATYPRGKFRYSTDSGGTYTDLSNKSDLPFRILHGGAQASVAFTHTVAYTKTYL